MAKFRVVAEFYCYIDDEGMQKHVLPKEALETEEDDQGELELDTEDPFAPGKVFSSMDPESKKITDYFKILSVEGDSVKCVSAKHNAHYVFTAKEIKENLEKGRFLITTHKLWVAFRDDPEANTRVPDPYPIGTVFDIYKEKLRVNSVVVRRIIGSTVTIRSAKDGSDAKFQEGEIDELLAAETYRISTKQAYNLVAGENILDLDEPKETETPISADGTSVADEVKKQLDVLMGHLDRPLRLSGTDNGIWSGKKIGGDMEICKDEVHDLLDNEARGLRAVFVVTLMDKK